MIARALVCVGPKKDLVACAECRVCRQIEAGSYAGYVSLRREGAHIEISQVRDLAERLALSFSGRRVVFLPQIDRLTLPAANAFLKILEEPGGETVFLLTAERIANLPPTVLSRCHRLPFFPERREQEAPFPAELLSLSPAEIWQRDSRDLLALFPGGSDREKLENFFRGALRLVSEAIGARLSGKDTPSFLAEWPLEKLLDLSEELLGKSQDLPWNVNTDLLFEIGLALLFPYEER